MKIILRSLQTTALAAALAVSPSLMAQTSSDPTRGSNPSNSGTDAGTNPNTGSSTSPNANTDMNGTRTMTPPSASGSNYAGDRSYDRTPSHNFGWIGLLGLAGLTGLFRRDHRNDVRGNPPRV